MAKNSVSVTELANRLRSAGIKGVAQRGVRALYRRLDVASIDFTIRPHEIADSTRLPEWRSEAATTDGPPRVGFVCTAPGAGSGGHTTLFRMIKGLEERGYPCTLFLYDPHDGDLGRREAVVREHWPWLSATIRSANESFDSVDAIVASSWETAHLIASRVNGPAARLYFAQDYEPFFYPHGSLYAFAEDSYRFGLRTIALGHMVASHVRENGIDVDFAPFGCDTDVYSLHNRGPRSGVVFYAKPDNDRRGYLLGKAALEIFHRQHPNVDIHVYGDPVADWTIPVVRHNRLSPPQLNNLYNQSIGGLALSFTNISLVAEELLAAGAIPVINDSASAKADLANTQAVWVQPTPGGLAEGLSRIVHESSDRSHALDAARQVRKGWGPAQEVVATVVRDELARVAPEALSVSSEVPLAEPTSDGVIQAEAASR